VSEAGKRGYLTAHIRATIAAQRNDPESTGGGSARTMNIVE